MPKKRKENSCVNAAGATHIGQVRQTNQDSHASRAGIHVLADGMGGHQGGEVASLEAISTILETGKIDSVADMVKSVSKANQAIIKRANRDETLSGMGTTVCLLTEILGSDGEIKIGIANVGDSRIYRLGGSELTQVTLDHSLVADLVRSGELTLEEASRHPQRNILTRALGIEQDLVIDTWELTPVAGDRYLLCSDGLFNEIDDEKIAEILMADEELDHIAQNLVNSALKAGGHDNITALVVSVTEEIKHENGKWFLNEMVPYPVVKPLLNTSIDQEIRNFDWKPIAICLSTLLLIVSVFTAIGLYARNGWFVGEYNGGVAIYKGRPQGVLWFEPTVERKTQISILDLSKETRQIVVDSISMDSFEEAERFVNEIRN
ncbi:MAG: Stp1/IreP family PP2C-type Ser/Thr phosphatase [Acidimicrobiales bacterium]|nr:Stp1/IreP family PP2C-type Ser/Thr phosphatase [Acidimicrobiales bacterium]